MYIRLNFNWQNAVSKIHTKK